MEKMYANLHFHSTHSDGVYTPSELVDIAINEGYKAIALTDHDVATGVSELIEKCKEKGIQYLYGTEFTCNGTEDNICFHIVGFEFDESYPRMQKLLEHLSLRTTVRTKFLFEKCLKEGTIKGITWEEIVRYNEGITWFCNEHVFRAMKNKGLITDLEYPEFFKNFVYTVPFDNPYDIPTLEDTLDIINEAGGVAVLAHPHGQLKYVPQLVEKGLKGIEIEHHLLTEEEKAEAHELAKKYKLYISGGSDHHGLMGGEYDRYPADNNPFYTEPCQYGTTKENFEEIKNRVFG